jgi:hypothetical protein
MFFFKDLNMKKIIIGVVILIAIVGGVSVLNKGGENENGQPLLPGGQESEQNGQISSGIENVCEYFQKELIESAIGKSIVKVESPFSDNKSCFYYTFYSETYDHTPYGDKPGGTQVVVVYDDEDLIEDKAYNETHGSIYGSDPAIGMENYVVRNNVNKIWQTVLILGQEKFIRIHFIDDAVTGEDLVKIAAKFAERIKND